MSEISQEDTAAELRVRGALRELGAAYRTNVRKLPGSPDVANVSRGRAVFVNGCFWHGHEGCERSRVPQRNSAFWLAKLRANRDRDRRKEAELRALGISPLVLWECEVEDQEQLRQRLQDYWFGAPKLNGTNGHCDNSVDSSGLIPRVHPALFEEYSCVPGEQSAYRCVRRRDGSHVVSAVARNAATARIKDASSIFDASWLRLRERPEAPDGAEVVRTIDLFSGCGAMTLGVQEASRALGLGHEAVLAADMNADARRIYVRNFPGAKAWGMPIQEQVGGRVGAKLTSSERKFQSSLGDVDVLVAGPPCQGHSDLNNHTRRRDPKNALAFRVVRVAELVQPQHIIIENVRGILHDRGSVFGRVRGALERLGYSVDATTAKSEGLGVAQSRHRVLLVASLERDVELETWLGRFRTSARSFNWAAGDLAGGEAETVFDTSSRPTDRNKRRMDYLFDNGLHELPDSERPDCHKGGGHSYKSVYGRMYAGKPAQTITTGFGCMGQGRFVHPKERRTITPHEAARLQFIPDFFDFGDVKRTSLARLIGNAVPPKLTYAIALSLLR